MKYLYTVYPVDHTGELLIDSLTTFTCEAQDIIEADEKFKDFCEITGYLFCGYGSKELKKQMPWNVTTWSPDWRQL